MKLKQAGRSRTIELNGCFTLQDDKTCPVAIYEVVFNGKRDVAFYHIVIQFVYLIVKFFYSVSVISHEKTFL